MNDESPSPSACQRVLGYCHDSVGVGHLRRTLAICERLGETHPDASFLLVTGTPYVPLFDQPAHVDTIKLPALTKLVDGEYHSKYLSVSLRQLLRCRASLIRQAALNFEPDLLLVDKAALGVCGELLPTLRWLRRHRPHVRIVFGMRDIEDEPNATIADWAREGVQQVLEECYDEIWVYGTEAVFDVVAQYRLSNEVARKLRYMGYVSRPPCGHKTHGAPNGQHHDRVLVTVGGGTDGSRLLESYLAKAGNQVAAAGGRSVIVGGPDLPRSAADRLREQSSRIPGVQWLDFEACMSCRIREADLVVSMGGYNTLTEVAAHRKPVLVIPRTQPRLEQKIRAELWQKHGAVTAVCENGIDPDGLASEVLRLLRTGPRVTEPLLDLRGLMRVAERFDSFWAEERIGATAVRV